MFYQLCAFSLAEVQFQSFYQDLLKFLIKFPIFCDISSVVPKITKIQFNEKILHTLPAKKSLQNMRLSSNNFGLTKSCYWTVTNFSDPCMSQVTCRVSHVTFRCHLNIYIFCILADPVREGLSLTWPIPSSFFL